MSGHAEKRMTDTAGEGGRSGFIAKPFSKAELAVELHAVLEGNAAAA
jgi:hypothetical protein